MSVFLSCTDAAKHAHGVTSDVAATLLQLISHQASDSRRAPSSPLSATPPPAPSPAAATETQFTQDQDLRYTLGGAAGPSWNVALNFIFWLLSFFFFTQCALPVYYSLMCFFLPFKEKVNVKGTVLECEWMMFIPPSDVQHYLRAVFSHVSDCNSLWVLAMCDFL